MDNEDAGPSGAVNDEAGVQGGPVASECDGCMRRFKLNRWREGLRCPECGSGRLSPLVAEGGAVDYCVADRRQGYAQQDIRFAQWLKWSGMISQRQYDAAFSRQFHRIREGEPPPPIHRVMVEQGLIKEEKALRVLEFMGRQRPAAGAGGIPERAAGRQKNRRDVAPRAGG